MALAELYTQSVRSTGGLVVSEALWAIGVVNGGAIDFYDLHVDEAPPEDALHSLPFLSTLMVFASHSSITQLAVCPHDPTLMAAGSARGEVALLRLRRHSPTAPLLVHKTRESSLSSLAGAVEALCFHPRHAELMAVACAGDVRMIQHGLGMLLPSEPCAIGSSPTAALTWCARSRHCLRTCPRSRSR